MDEFRELLDDRYDQWIVQNNICQFLRENEGFQADFLVNDQLWYLNPELREGVTQYETMDSLDELLRQGTLESKLSAYKSKEKTILCYILATSMLFLYPKTWIQAEWDSSKVYFSRHPDIRSNFSPLIFPYLSTELQQLQEEPTTSHVTKPCHSHPALLYLGIIFLEIATGVKFERSQQQFQVDRINCNGKRAYQQLQDLNRQSHLYSSKRISPALKKAIHFCLKVDPPPTFASKYLQGDGPVRQYILSCIIRPLAEELEIGYKIKLEELHGNFSPNVNRGGAGDLDTQGFDAIRPPSEAAPGTVNAAETPYVCGS